MTDLSNATLPQLWLRVQRLRLARWAMWTCRAFADLAEWITPPRICGRGFEPYVRPSAAFLPFPRHERPDRGCNGGAFFAFSGEVMPCGTKKGPPQRPAPIASKS